MSADQPAQTHVYEGAYLVDWPDDERFLPMREVLRLTGMSRTTILSRVDAGRLPRPFQLGAAEDRYWLRSEILAWLSALTTKRPAAPATRSPTNVQATTPAANRVDPRSEER